MELGGVPSEAPPVRSELVVVRSEPAPVWSKLGRPQQQPACRWLCRPPATEPGLGLACPCTHVLPCPLAPCCQLATGFCKGMAAVIAPSLVSPSELDTAALDKHGCCSACMPLMVAGAGLRGGVWGRLLLGAGAGQAHAGSGCNARQQFEGYRCCPLGAQFGPNWPGFGPNRAGFGPNWTSLVQSEPLGYGNPGVRV